MYARGFWGRVYIECVLQFPRHSQYVRGLPSEDISIIRRGEHDFLLWIQAEPNVGDIILVCIIANLIYFKFD